MKIEQEFVLKSEAQSVSFKTFRIFIYKFIKSGQAVHICKNHPKEIQSIYFFETLLSTYYH